MPTPPQLRPGQLRDSPKSGFAFQMRRGTFPWRCCVPNAYLETERLPFPLGFQGSQMSTRERWKIHPINTEKNTLTKLSRSTRVRESTGGIEVDFQLFFFSIIMTKIHTTVKVLHANSNITVIPVNKARREIKASLTKQCLWILMSLKAKSKLSKIRVKRRLFSD